MTTELTNADRRIELAVLYRAMLLNDVIPFWLRHGLDRGHGEWLGCLHREGSVSSRAKGTMWKGPFHLPRMLWYGARVLASEGP